MLTPHDIEAFHQTGLYVARGVFGPAERQPVLDALERIRIRADREKPHGLRTLKDGSSWGLSHTFRQGYFEPAVADVLAHPTIQHVLTALLGTSELRMWGDHALWSSDTADYDLHWHRDKTWGQQPFPRYDRQRPHHIQFNAAFGPDGAFRAVAGSHLRDATAEEEAAMAPKSPTGVAPLPGEVHVELAPGDVVFMNAWTVHRGKTAKASGRRTVHFSVQPAGLAAMPGETRNGREGIFDPWLREQFSPIPRRMYDALIRFQQTLPERAS